MKKLTRRDFIEFALKIAALTGISPSVLPKIVNALEELSRGNASVLWLQGQSCSGCSVSLLNSAAPGAAEILTNYISLRFHSTLSTATGATSMNIIDQTIKAGDFLLVVEGSIPAGMPEACIVERRLTFLWEKLKKWSKTLLSILKQEELSYLNIYFRVFCGRKYCKFTN